MKTFIYTPENVCSRKIIIIYEDDIIQSVSFEGGCQGNLRGIASLVKGMRFEEVISKLKGIECHGSRGGRTSCPDQFALALLEIMKNR